MADQDTESTPKLDIDWLKTAAGALAAVTTAVLLSTLGAVGTLIGAALGSVAATVGSAIYTQGLAKSRQAVLKAQETAMHKIGIAQAEVRRAERRQGDDTAVEAHLDAADARLGEVKGQLEEEFGESGREPAGPTWGDRLRALPWKRIALLAAATFLIVMLAITAFEKLAGQSVSNLTGGSGKDHGTTFGGVTGGGSSNDRPDKPDRPDHSLEPSTEESPGEEPTGEESTPSATPTETSSPSATPTPTPSATPTPTPTPTSPTPNAPTPSPTQ